MTVKLSVFITGATGYIGGEFLYKLLDKSKNEYTIRALVRSQEKASLLQKKTSSRVETVIGTLDDSNIIESEASKADIIVDAATNNHLSSAKIFNKVLSSTERTKILFHISGVSLISSETDRKVWSDIKDNKEILDLPDNVPHIAVDREIWGIQDINTEYARTVIISPATIFGTSYGYDNIYSSQIPKLVESSLKLGQSFTVEDGEFEWSHVHINYLGDLFLLLLENLINDKNSVRTGKDGLYFVATGTHTWKGVSLEIAKLLKEKGAIDSQDIKELTREETDRLVGSAYSSLWATNAITEADLAKSYGWKPKNTTLFWKNVGVSVDVALSK